MSKHLCFVNSDAISCDNEHREVIVTERRIPAVIVLILVLTPCRPTFIDLKSMSALWRHTRKVCDEIRGMIFIIMFTFKISMTKRQ